MTSNRSAEELYFYWLCAQVDVVINDNHSNSITTPVYSKLFEELYSIEFTWSISNDDNRAYDGLYLREMFESETGTELYLEGVPCSFLEMLIGLARRCSEDVMSQSDFDNTPYFWFWCMIRNCGLDMFDDDNYHKAFVRHIVDRIVSRSYARNGVGSLFPLTNIDVDMRKVEIWYQLSYWLDENFDIFEENGSYIV